MLSPTFTEALAYAAQLHAWQQRKGLGQEPYMAHLLAVAGLVLQHGGDEEQAIAALLHDSLEDAGQHFGTARLREHIARRFGEPVLALVLACTDTETFPKPPWRERKQQHLAHVMELEPRAKLIIAADKLHNARAVRADMVLEGEAVFARFGGGRDGTLWYYRAMLEAIRDSLPPALLWEFEQAVQALETAVAGAPSHD
jgi:(p)ppGpp synthase/HD superfamily hydrolase